eukprot:TRINITY_DN6901_c0_g1_i1.p1 TRINITY_DN6901_c0_g1~~TRINITY_DN6901_c0_g1_i1.p1  ORF type:complete len:257 (-),score=83.52 TRINITY_DN6901_c0_g1_i1:402-1172(-)
MDFMKLDITKAAELDKEVGKIEELHEKLVKENNAANIMAFKQEIERRIATIEDFIDENDMDDRHTLFKTNSLRLRKLLQKNEMMDMIKTMPKAKPHTPKVRPSTPKSVKSKRVAKPVSPMSIESQTANLTLAKASKKGKKPKYAPLYSWEKTEANLAAPQEVAPIVDAENFVEPVEFRVILTEEEFAEFKSRQRQFIAETKHRQRVAAKKSNTPTAANASVTNVGPYVDPHRLQQHNSRKANKGRWLTQDGFGTSQ